MKYSVPSTCCIALGLLLAPGSRAVAQETAGNAKFISGNDQRIYVLLGHLSSQSRLSAEDEARVAELLRGRLGNGEGRTEFLGLLNQRGNVVLLGVEKGFRSKEEAVRLSALSALREFAGRLLQEDEKELANRLLLGSLLTEHGSTLMGAMVTAIDITPSASPSVRSNIIETLVSIMSRRVERESGFAAYALDTLGEGQRVPEDMRSALQRSH